MEKKTLSSVLFFIILTTAIVNIQSQEVHQSAEHGDYDISNNYTIDSRKIRTPAENKTDGAEDDKIKTTPVNNPDNKEKTQNTEVNQSTTLTPSITKDNQEMASSTQTTITNPSASSIKSGIETTTHNTSVNQTTTNITKDIEIASTVISEKTELFKSTNTSVSAMPLLKSNTTQNIWSSPTFRRVIGITVKATISLVTIVTVGFAFLKYFYYI